MAGEILEKCKNKQEKGKASRQAAGRQGSNEVK